jgi:hypothetical protein
MNTLSISGN